MLYERSGNQGTTVVPTYTGDGVRGQLIALVTLADEGAYEVVALMLTRMTGQTLVHIWGRDIRKSLRSQNV